MNIKSMSDHFNEEAKKHENNFINIMGMSEFYDEIEKQLEKFEARENILVLGCGTGLEIERIKFKTNIIAVDIAEEMIHELEKKQLFEEISLKTICSSFFDLDFQAKTFDIIISCYVMHHFTEEQKSSLYKKIYSSLKDTGCFINGDTMLKTHEEELSRFIEAEKIYKEKKLPFGSLHIDIPFCYEHEVNLLKKAGFKNIKLAKEWEVTKLYQAFKL